MGCYFPIIMKKRHVIAILVVVGVAIGIVNSHSRTVQAVNLYQGRTLVIDPGHGGKDAGASRGEAVEKEIVLEIAFYLREYLEASGASVHLTRETDTDLAGEGEGTRKSRDMAARAALGNSLQPDAFISIHANAFPSSRWGGAQTFYNADSNPNNERLAKSIQGALVEHTGMTQRQVSQNIDHYVLKHVTAPAVTVEVGFLSHPEECRLLQTPEYQRKVAWAIFLGLGAFFKGF